jgi:sulfur-oxidizing protein SoxB
MQFDDLHAHLTPHKDLIAQNGQTVVVERGGLARLATLIKKIRAENPNSVLMNIGDTYHGGVEGLYTNGNAAVDPVNALGVDVGVPGNWDYAYGPGVFRLRYATGLSAFQTRMLQAVAGTVKRPSFTNLAANLTYAAPSMNTGYVMPPNVIRSIGGVKVGFIGLTSDIVAQMSSALAIGFSFTQGEADYTSLLNTQAAALRAQGAKLVVVMSELGLHKNYRLADVIKPGAVDVIFSAHTHEPTAKPLQGRSGALVLESGNDGNLGRLDVNIVAGRQATYTWTLLPVDNTLAEDAGVKSLVDAARAPFLVANPNLTVPMMGATLHLSRSIDTVVGYVNTPLDRRNALESSFNDTWAEALREYAKTDLAITPGFRYDAVIAAPGTHYEDGAIASGAVTLEDVYRFFPVPYTLAAGSVTGERLQQILEGNLQAVFSLDSFNQEGGWVDGYAGLAAQVDLSAADGQRVQALALQSSGATITPSSVLSVAGCQRPNDGATVLCANDGFSNVASLIDPATGSAYYVQDLFAKLLSSGSIYGAAAKGITDRAATPLWPAQPFVQPLMVDVTAQTRIAQSAVSAQGEVTVSVRNIGTSALALPLKLVVQGLPAGVTLANASGSVYGNPYLKLPSSIPPGATASYVLHFSNPAALPIGFSLRVNSGGV